MVDSLDNNFKTSLKEVFSFLEDVNDLHTIANSLFEYFEHVSDEQLETVAKKSFRHLNGFYKIVLFESDDRKTKVRLHVWNSDYKDLSESNPHDHRWAYLSMPLFGSLHEKRYKETNSNDGISKHKYHCFSRSNEMLSTAEQGSVELVLDSEHVRSAGNVYNCPAGAIHLLEPAILPTATLIVTHDPVREFARVYKDGQQPANYAEISVPSITVEELKNFIRKVKEQYQESSASQRKVI